MNARDNFLILFKKILIILFFLPIFSAVGINAQEPFLSSKHLVIGTKEAPPFSMKAKNGLWTGISIDLWLEIASDLSLSIEFCKSDLEYTSLSL